MAERCKYDAAAACHRRSPAANRHPRRHACRCSLPAHTRRRRRVFAQHGRWPTYGHHRRRLYRPGGRIGRAARRTTRHGARKRRVHTGTASQAKISEFIRARASCPRCRRRAVACESSDLRRTARSDPGGQRPRQCPARTRELPAESVVVGSRCMHRTPNSRQAAGLKCDNGIVVDEYCRTEDPRVYAAGRLQQSPKRPCRPDACDWSRCKTRSTRRRAAASNICGNDQDLSRAAVVLVEPIRSTTADGRAFRKATTTP